MERVCDVIILCKKKKQSICVFPKGTELHHVTNNIYVRVFSPLYFRSFETTHCTLRSDACAQLEVKSVHLIVQTALIPSCTLPRTIHPDCERLIRPCTCTVKPWLCRICLSPECNTVFCSTNTMIDFPVRSSRACCYD